MKPNNSHINVNFADFFPLLDTAYHEFSHIEFKIFSYYFTTLVHTKGERNREVIIPDSELKKYFGTNPVEKESLTKVFSHLLGASVDVPVYPDPSYDVRDQVERCYFVKIFEAVSFVLEKNGKWIVRLECTESIWNHFFKGKDLEYILYLINGTANLKIGYSYDLFKYLEENRNVGVWVTTVDDFRHMLGCDQSKTYGKFKNFNNLVLKKIKSELMENTDCKFLMEYIKSGRNIVAIRISMNVLTYKR